MLPPFAMSYHDLIVEYAAGNRYLYTPGETPTAEPLGTMPKGAPYNGEYVNVPGVMGGNGWLGGSRYYFLGQGLRPAWSGFIKIDPSFLYTAGVGITLLKWQDSKRNKTDSLNISGTETDIEFVIAGFYNGYTTVKKTFPKSDFAGEWHHIAFGYGGISGAVWLTVDGELVLEYSSVAGASSYGAVHVGPQTSTPGIHMDEWAYFDNHSLTLEKIGELANYQPPVDGPAEVTALPADATSEMLDASGGIEAGYTAEAIDAHAGLNEPLILAGRNKYTIRALGRGVTGRVPSYDAPYFYNIFGTSNLKTISFGRSGNKEVTSARSCHYLRVPSLDHPELAPGDVVTGIRLVLKDVSPGSSTNSQGHMQAADSPDESFSGTPPTTGRFPLAPGNTYTFDVPLDKEYVRVWTIGGTEKNVFFDNPANDEQQYTESHYLLTVEPAPTTHVDAPVMTASATAFTPTVTTVSNPEAKPKTFTATASMPMPTFEAQTAADVATRPIAFAAIAEMTRVIMPNIAAYPDAAEATAEARPAWFNSHTAHASTAATAQAEAVGVPEVTAGRNIILAAKPASMRDAWIINPEEVNEDIVDPYWLRVTGRATEGHLPSRDGEWYRFQERAGDRAHRTDFNTGLRMPFAERTAGATLTGVYGFGANGPNGRRALAVQNAGMDVARDDTFMDKDRGGSLEFTIRVEPGHTGRMDIANGNEDYFYDASSTGFKAKSHVSVRNGKIYASTSFGGTSVKRIDDGQWHHIVITSSARNYLDAGDGFRWRNSEALEIWIDANLDRALIAEENRLTGYNTDTVRLFARPDRYFGQETGYPFKGEILEVAYRRSYLRSHEITDLYLDMFGYKAVRAGAPMLGMADMPQGHKVQSNMKRMLVLSFDVPYNKYFAMQGITLAPWHDGFHPRSMNLTDSSSAILSDMIGYGTGDDINLGRYRADVQSVHFLKDYNQARSYVRPEVIEAHTDNPNAAIRFRDLDTAERRLINLQTDVDLDNYDVIAFQGYQNHVFADQAERLRYEDFFASVNQALIDGHKIWINDAYLAADLGWVSDVDEVPVYGQDFAGKIRMNGGMSHYYYNDVRSYEIAPWIGLHGETMEKPADGSMPVLPAAPWDGMQHGINNIWAWDMHRNNGYRVVNEVPGLTDLPTWEVEESFYRNRLEMFPIKDQWEQHGWKLSNRSGQDMVNERESSEGYEYTLTKPSEGSGLQVGDEFYDWTWIQHGMNYYKYAGNAADSIGSSAAGMRVVRTWAIPPGHLRLGSPVSTFRSTVWNDFGNEVANPYRNHIRNAVVRPGDRLPDGRKVNGYAFMEFAEHPKFGALAGVGIVRDITYPAGIGRFGSPNIDGGNENVSDGMSEDEYSYTWDLLTAGRTQYGAGGKVNLTERVSTVSWSVDKSTGKPVQSVESSSVPTGEVLPIAQSRTPLHPQVWVPHMTWNSRGIAWLTLVESEDAEFALSQSESMEATGQMNQPTVTAKFDNVVKVGAAHSTANIVAPAESKVRDVKVLAFPATAGGVMNGLQGGYIAQAATSYGDMPQNVLRPLDIEEVLFFTLTFSQEAIYLRMEEN